MWTHTKESQDKITPQKALEFLKEGNLRFNNNLKTDRNLLRQVNQTSEGQFPFATILSCIDSRTSAELIFDQGLGDIFSIRIAGNVLNEDILGSMEYACDIAKSKIIVVLGHTNCGAIISACNNVDIGHITSLLRKIKPAIESEVTILNERNGNNVNFVKSVCINNVNLSIMQIREQNVIITDVERNGDILIISGLYSVETGVVRFF